MVASAVAPKMDLQKLNKSISCSTQYGHIGKVYVDLDDVLCETIRGFLRLLHSTLGKCVEYHDVYSFDLKKSFSLSTLEAAEFFDHCHSPATLMDLEPCEFAADVLSNWTQSGLYVSVVTGRPRSTRNATEQWLKLNKMQYSELLFVDKYGRDPGGRQLKDINFEEFGLVVEDNLDVASELANRKQAIVVLFEKPWNIYESVSEQCSHHLVRCRSWIDISNVCSGLLGKASGDDAPTKSIRGLSGSASSLIIGEPLDSASIKGIEIKANHS